jgi:flagellar basal-body rod protein FlgB
MGKVNNNSMASGMGGAADERFWENATRLYSKRLEVIASNIANADTPNFKARDIDFKKALEQSLSTAMVGERVVASARRLPAEPVSPPLLFRVPAQQGVDGNTVELDAERVAFAETAIRYEFAMQKAVGEYKEISELFKTLTG